jgi:hypothetical protein
VGGLAGAPARSAGGTRVQRGKVPGARYPESVESIGSSIMPFRPLERLSGDGAHTTDPDSTPCHLPPSNADGVLHVAAGPVAPR